MSVFAFPRGETLIERAAFSAENHLRLEVETDPTTPLVLKNAWHFCALYVVQMATSMPTAALFAETR